MKKVGARIQKLQERAQRMEEEAIAFERKMQVTEMRNAAALESQRINAAVKIAEAKYSRPVVNYNVRYYWW